MKIVLVGGGFTALEAGPRIKKLVPNSEVTLINKNQLRQLHFPSELLNHHPHALDIKKHCKDHGIEFILGQVTKIDRDEKTVHVGDAVIPYDYLVLDIGSEPTIKETERVIACNNRHHMHQLKHHVVGQVIKSKYDYNPSHRTFAVAGASINGLESVTELQTFIGHVAERHLFFPEEFTTVLITNDQPLPKKLKRILEDKDIEVYESSVKEITDEGVDLNDRTIQTHTLAWAESNPNSFISQLGLPLINGAVETDEYLRTDDHRIFAVGGCATRTRALPSTALYRDDAEVLSYNIAASINNKKLRVFNPGRKPFTVSTGAGKAFLSTRFFTFHGAFPFAIREHFASKHRARIQKP